MPLVKDGKKWVEYYWDYEDWENDPIQYQSGIICFQLNGVSEINGITYHNLYATMNSDKITDNSTPIAYVREQDKKVFVMINEGCNVDFPMGYHPLEMDRCQYFPENNEYLIYDFNDITSPYEAGSFTYNSVDTEQALVNGQLVNIYYVPTNRIIYYEDNKGGFMVQEGVGALHEVFINPWPLYPTNGLRFSLAFVEENGHYLYRGAYYEKAKELMGHEYLPVLSEGKSWQVATYNDDPNDIIKVYSVSVGGDTIVNNLTCKKIDVVPKDSHMATASPVAYEENGKVWKVEENGQMVLIFDVGLHLNEQFNGVAHVVGEDVISVNGVSRKRLLIDSGCDCVNYMYYVVEGVGISLDECVMYLGVGNGSHPCRMVSCSENGETIFTYNDFYKKKEYVPLVREGVVWEYVGYYQEDEMEYDNPQRYNLYTLEFSGATTIDGKLYYKIYRTEYDKLGNAKEPYLAAYVREEDKVVTAIENTNHYYWWMIPRVLYDFNETMFLPYEAFFDGWDIPYDYHYIQNVSSIEIEVGGTTRRGYYIENDFSWNEGSFKTIEGIGVDCGFGDLLIPYRDYCTCENPLASLSAVYENGQLVYKGRAYDQAQQMKHKKEDVNCDGYVTSADVTALYDFLLGNNTEATSAYDVDGDGTVTAADITAIYNKLLGEE